MIHPAIMKCYLMVGALLLSLPAVAQPAAPADGETRSCIVLSNLRQSIVRGDQIIDFVMRDGSVWRNTLPYRCPTLGFQRAFSYQTSINQLCKPDLISVIQLNGGNPITSRCGLGTFVRQPAPTQPRAK